MTTLWWPGGRVTFFWAKALMRERTTSIPRSSDALSSSTASLNDSPSIVRASASTDVVLPVPGGPERMRLGMLPCWARTWSRPTVASFPTISPTVVGRYFSSHGCSKPCCIATLPMVARRRRAPIFAPDRDARARFATWTAPAARPMSEGAPSRPDADSDAGAPSKLAADIFLAEAVAPPTSAAAALASELFAEPADVARRAPADAALRASALAGAIFNSPIAAPAATSAAPADADAGGNILRNLIIGDLEAQPAAPPSSAETEAAEAAARLHAARMRRRGVTVSSEGPANTLQHLLILIHGIGQHEDFSDDRCVSWDGTEGGFGGNHEFRELLESTLDGRLGSLPMSLAVRSIEWHSHLHAGPSGGPSGLLAACEPRGVPELRAVTRDTIMDVLYYSTSASNAQATAATAIAAR